MPLDSPEAYEALREHLAALDDVLTSWTEARGFTRHEQTGSYPERRYHRDTTTPNVFLSLALQRDHAGRFEAFHPDLPYSACLGFFLPQPDTRSKRIILFHHIPFESLRRDLLTLLDPADVYLRETRVTDLLEHSDPTRLYFFDHTTQTGGFTEGWPWL